MALHSHQIGEKTLTFKRLWRFGTKKKHGRDARATYTNLVRRSQITLCKGYSTMPWAPPRMRRGMRVRTSPWFTTTSTEYQSVS
jgi:hypothetical protein